MISGTASGTMTLRGDAGPRSPKGTASRPPRHRPSAERHPGPGDTPGETPGETGGEMMGKRWENGRNKDGKQMGT